MWFSTTFDGSTLYVGRKCISNVSSKVFLWSQRSLLCAESDKMFVFGQTIVYIQYLHSLSLSALCFFFAGIASGLQSVEILDLNIGLALTNKQADEVLTIAQVPFEEATCCWMTAKNNIVTLTFG